MAKAYTITEIAPECYDRNIYFDTDAFFGDQVFCQNLFITEYDDRGHPYGFNDDLYTEIRLDAENLTNYFYYLERGEKWKETFKSIMELYGIPYSSKKCHLMREWAEKEEWKTTEGTAYRRPDQHKRKDRSRPCRTGKKGEVKMSELKANDSTLELVVRDGNEGT